MIALFGGSFNPIHNGHIGLARWIVSHHYADKVWLMVSPQNPLKPAPGLADEDLRLRWAKMACENVANVEASDFEFGMPRPSYTWQTLAALHKEYPKEEFALAIGADNWLCFDRWARHEWIVENVRLLVYPREGYEINPDTLPQGVTLMPAPLFPFSSTAIRKGLMAHEDVSDMLPANVLRDIKRRKIYTEQTFQA